jgi:type IV pilus assembly protein PilA
MLKRFKKNQKGFTLVELIVVIAILGVLAALIVPRILGNVDEATKEREIANARTIASEITIHNAKAVTANKITITPCTQVAYEAKGLRLPEGITWPDATVVVIRIDASGNASIDETPATTPTP